jgi:hypothetical protein
MLYNAINTFTKPLDKSVIQGLFNDVTTYHKQIKL